MRMTNFIQYFLTNMFRPLLRPCSGRRRCGIPHCQHITYTLDEYSPHHCIKHQYAHDKQFYFPNISIITHIKTIFILLTQF